MKKKRIEERLDAIEAILKQHFGWSVLTYPMNREMPVITDEMVYPMRRSGGGSYRGSYVGRAEKCQQ
jgi:hypothetical protein